MSWVLVLVGLRICFLLELPFAGGFFFSSWFRFFRSTLLVYRFLLRLYYLGCYTFYSCLPGLVAGWVSASFVRQVLCSCACSMIRAVTDDLGSIIGCFWAKVIDDWLSRPLTRSIPSLSMNGLSRVSFPFNATFRSFRSARISSENWMPCNSFISL